jgi:hypothetical protein
MFFGGLIMNKFLITIATLVAFALGSVAVQAQEVTGFMQRIVGAGDDVDGGIAEQFTKFIISAETTADNGWAVGGSMSIQTAATTGGVYAPSTNNMYVVTDMMTINIGNTVSAMTSLIPAVSAMVPGGGIDAGYQFLFDNGNNLGSNGIQGREAYYAHNAAKIDIDLPAVNGFTVGVTYIPSYEFNGTTPSGRAQAETSAAHGETIEIAMQYSGEAEGMSYTLGAGVESGNSQSQNAGTVTHTNNDLASFSAAIKITMGNTTLGVAGYDNGDSFGASGDTVKASDSGYNVNIVHAMGNITVGAGFSHQAIVRGTRAQAAATTLTSAAAGNVREDNFTYFGIGYDMGGGVNTYVQFSDNDHDDGDLVTNEADPQVLFAGINIGF